MHQNLLGDPDPSVRRAAALCLGATRQPANESVTALHEALDDSNLLVRLAAVNSLGMLGAKGGPALTEALGNDHFAVRAQAMCSLELLGSRAIGALSLGLRDIASPAVRSGGSTTAKPLFRRTNCACVVA